MHVCLRLNLVWRMAQNPASVKVPRPSRHAPAALDSAPSRRRFGRVPRVPPIPRTGAAVRRPSFAAAAALLLALSACDWVQVERTPSQFYNQRDPARVDQRDDARELRARVRNFADELARGNRERALTALNPSEGVLVIGSQVGSGVAQIGVRGLAAALDSAAVPTPAVARTPDLRVEVGLRERTGWFSAPIQFMTLAAGSEAQWLRVSGVFAQQKGEWKLVEIHLSKPWAPPGATPADTAGRDSAGPPPVPAAATDSPRRTSP